MPLAAAVLALLVPALAAAQPPRLHDPNVERANIAYQEGWSYMRTERFEEALTAFQRAIELNPKLNLAYYGQGRAYLALHRYADAIKALSACRDTYNLQAGQKFAGQADAQQLRQDRLTELADLKTQYTKAPQTSQNQDTVRMIQNAIRDTQEAASRGMNISFDLATPSFVSLSLGSAYFRAEKMDDAEKEFKAALAADSKSGEAHNNLAVLYFTQGKATLASQHIKAAEKVGFRVNPDLKDQVKEAMGR
jgi:tetratricopeptide (TPR) repeat protein